MPATFEQAVCGCLSVRVSHSLFLLTNATATAASTTSGTPAQPPARALNTTANICGGRVKLHFILMAPSEFDHDEKGDALYAMELALSFEKLVNEKLLNLRSVEAIKKIADYVTQLRMLGMDMIITDALSNRGMSKLLLQYVKSSLIQSSKNEQATSASSKKRQRCLGAASQERKK